MCVRSEVVQQAAVLLAWDMPGQAYGSHHMMNVGASMKCSCGQ